MVATFFARGDTATPVKASLTAVAVNIAFKIVLMGPLAQVGLALATAIGAWINLAAGRLVRRRARACSRSMRGCRGDARAVRLAATDSRGSRCGWRADPLLARFCRMRACATRSTLAGAGASAERASMRRALLAIFAAIGARCRSGTDPSTPDAAIVAYAERCAGPTHHARLTCARRLSRRDHLVRLRYNVLGCPYRRRDLDGVLMAAIALAPLRFCGRAAVAVASRRPAARRQQPAPRRRRRPSRSPSRSKQTVIDQDEYVGRFVAVDSVEVRARVSGYLEKVHFTDGQLVKQGDLLFTIDKRPFQNALDQARANLATGARQSLVRRGRPRARAATLVRERTISEQVFEQRTQAKRTAEASVAAQRSRGATGRARSRIHRIARAGRRPHRRPPRLARQSGDRRHRRHHDAARHHRLDRSDPLRVHLR